ncbi:hypothetical protein niasHS_009113 [Heterodera schachtii]|uniref:Uncharacterized protein n=1 Tax=Heterodera schachtii TaxID=97005 RepID=A0ABD2JDQ5_HETSC
MDVLDKLVWPKDTKLMLAQSFSMRPVVLCKAALLVRNLPIKPRVGDIDESDEEDEEEEQSEELKSKSGTEKEVVEDQQQKEKTEEQKEKRRKKREVSKGTDECCGKRETEERSRDEVRARRHNDMAEVTLKTDNEEEADEDGGDEDDGQIAWESLEVARKICENQIKSDQAKLWTERKSDVLVALGDCMTVTENFPLALEEFTSALAIRKELFGEADRRTAEVYFWIGRTHKLMDDFKTAAEHFENAKKVLEAVIAAKERELKERGEENCDKPVDSIDTTEKARGGAKAMLQPLLMQVISANGNTPLEANDVTGMLKRKAVKRTLAMSDAIANDKTEADVEQNAKMPRNETDGGKGEERPTKDCEANGN